jgi:hypothetical protein
MLGIPASQLNKVDSVPDIAIIECPGLDANSRQTIPVQSRKQTIITLVEFTYTAENSESIEKATKSKIEKYKQLHDIIRNNGYASPELVVLVGGVRGWHPKATDTQLQNRLKLSGPERRLILRNMTLASWHYMQSIVRTRRYLEFNEYAFRSGLVAWREIKACQFIIRKRKQGR